MYVATRMLQKCVQEFTDGKLCLQLESFRALRNTLSRDEITKVVYAMLLQQKRGIWMFAGLRVCRDSWKRLVGIGSHRFHRLKAHADLGFLSPPNDIRFNAKPMVADSDVALHVDSFFSKSGNSQSPSPQ